jgi:hypothetical protein
MTPRQECNLQGRSRVAFAGAPLRQASCQTLARQAAKEPPKPTSQGRRRPVCRLLAVGNNDRSDQRSCVFEGYIPVGVRLARSVCRPTAWPAASVATVARRGAGSIAYFNLIEAGPPPSGLALTQPDVLVQKRRQLNNRALVAVCRQRGLQQTPQLPE